jgi:formyltetrahydrofolate-dependent phosphoribosylglycinamide formyltransferase
MDETTRQIIIFTDGGSRGNPGPAAAGYVLKDTSGNTLLAKGCFLGEQTNNFAEYSAIIKSLKAAEKFNPKSIKLFSDSELLVKQINGAYKVKSKNLKPLFEQVASCLSNFENWKVQHVYREKNSHADRLVNVSLDQKRDIEEKPDIKKAQTSVGKPIRLGILLSGGGRTMMNILKNIEQGRVNAEISLVISSKPQAGGVEKARRQNLNLRIIRKKDFDNIGDFSDAIKTELLNADIDLVVQAGWLCLWKIPKEYENKVMNIHPALLPSFGGKGMWGHHVHKAVLRKGCKVSGCTVHFCNNEYDKGPIIIQKACKVDDDDDENTLAGRVFQQECKAYPEAIELFEQNRLVVKDGIVKRKNNA